MMFLRRAPVSDLAPNLPKIGSPSRKIPLALAGRGQTLPESEPSAFVSSPGPGKSPRLTPEEEEERQEQEKQLERKQAQALALQRDKLKPKKRLVRGMAQAL